MSFFSDLFKKEQKREEPQENRSPQESPAHSESKLGAFFKKGKPRIFSCGKGNGSSAAKRLRNQVMSAAIFMMAGGTLSPVVSSVFSQSKQAEVTQFSPEHAIACRTSSGKVLTCRVLCEDSLQLAGAKEIVNAAMSTSTGEAVLTQFFKNKGTITVTSDLPDAYGCFLPDKNTIALNANFLQTQDGKASMKSTIVHEATHAKQKYSGIALSENLDAGSLIRAGRAFEADANTHEIFAASEMAALGDSLVWKEVCAYKPHMTQAFEQSRKQGKSEIETAKATMLAYYSEKEDVEVYDKMYLNWLEQLGENGERAVLRGQKTYSPAEIAAKVCVFKGQAYLGDEGGALLSDSLRNSVSERVFNSLKRSSRTHASNLKSMPQMKAKVDVSYEGFFVSQFDGHVRAPMRAISPGSVKTSVLQKGSVRGG